MDELDLQADLIAAQLLYPDMFGIPVCMPDDNYPLYDPVCGREPPFRLEGRDWQKVTCPDCLTYRSPQTA